jgi:hypothetical protein
MYYFGFGHDDILSPLSMTATVLTLFQRKAKLNIHAVHTRFKPRNNPFAP